VQARTVSRWIRELAKVTWVALCSGNHDNAGRQITADRAPVYEWVYELKAVAKWFFPRECRQRRANEVVRQKKFYFILAGIVPNRLYRLGSDR